MAVLCCFRYIPETRLCLVIFNANICRWPDGHVPPFILSQPTKGSSDLQALLPLVQLQRTLLLEPRGITSKMQKSHWSSRRFPGSSPVLPQFRIVSEQGGIVDREQGRSCFGSVRTRGSFKKQSLVRFGTAVACFTILAVLIGICKSPRLLVRSPVTNIGCRPKDLDFVSSAATVNQLPQHLRHCYSVHDGPLRAYIVTRSVVCRQVERGADTHHGKQQSRSINSEFIRPSISDESPHADRPMGW